jgi:AcrR family transcriptional regulator
VSSVHPDNATGNGNGNGNGNGSGSGSGSGSEAGQQLPHYGRTTKANRRSQLLDAAARLVANTGLAGFTMEGLATSAGVSKALPYRHFTNATDALIALMHREVAHLGEAMISACDGIAEGDPMMTAAIGAYFDVIADRGGLLNALAGPGSPLPELASGDKATPPSFLLTVIERGYHLRGQQATLTAWLITALAVAGSDSLARGDAPRTVIEPLTISAIIATIHVATIHVATIQSVASKTSAAGY